MRDPLEFQYGTETTLNRYSANNTLDTETDHFIELQNDHYTIRKTANTLKPSRKLAKTNDNSETLHRLSHLEQLFAKHCEKEQRILYPLIHKYLDAVICEEIDQEHKKISSLLQKMIHRTRSPVSSISLLNRLLSSHFSREENVLFWYLNIRLTSDNVHRGGSSGS